MTEVPPQSREALRAELAKDLKVPRLSQGTWVSLEEEDYIDDYLRRSDWEQYNVVLGQARILEKERFGLAPGKECENQKRRVLTPEEMLRAKVYSKHLARLASQRSEVRKLREKVIGGALLPHDQAEQLLQQIGPRFLALRWFRDNGLPLLGHTSRFTNLKGRSKRVGPQTKIQLKGNGKLRIVKNASDLFEAARRKGIHLRFLSDGAGHCLVGRRSVFGEIQRVASLIARDYHWPEEEATAFLVEGHVPFIDPLDLRIEVATPVDHHRIVVNLQFEPWVTDESVLKAFLNARRLSRKGQGRLIAERRLRLFDFVESYREETVKKGWNEMAGDKIRFPWREVASLWSKSHPEWEYRKPSELKAKFWETSEELLGFSSLAQLIDR